MTSSFLRTGARPASLHAQIVIIAAGSPAFAPAARPPND